MGIYNPYFANISVLIEISELLTKFKIVFAYLRCGHLITEKLKKSIHEKKNRGTAAVMCGMCAGW